MGWPLGLAEGSLAIWSPCLRALLFLASASWAAGTGSRAFLSPSLSPPWQQTSSKQTCPGSCELPIPLPSEFTGEGESAQRGYLANYRDTTKQDLNPDPCFPRGGMLSHAWPDLQPSGECDKRTLAALIPTMCFQSWALNSKPSMFYPLAGWREIPY